jgi:hypothetical protein
MTLSPVTARNKSPKSNLDKLFGVPEIPERRDDLEKAICPQSRERLNKETAERLLALMTATEKGLGVSRFVYCELPILWATDKNGDVWIAVEEVVDATTGQFVFPRIRQTEVSKGHKRLGHPALLRDTDVHARGRIIKNLGYHERLWTVWHDSGTNGRASE